MMMMMMIILLLFFSFSVCVSRRRPMFNSLVHIMRRDNFLGCGLAGPSLNRGARIPIEIGSLWQLGWTKKSNHLMIRCSGKPWSCTELHANPWSCESCLPALDMHQDFHAISTWDQVTALHCTIKWFYVRCIKMKRIQLMVSA